MAKMQTLHCQAGHDWERPSQRGKPPLWCAEHKPVKPKPAATVSGDKAKLICSECNKEWERPRQRGRAPIRCPECREKFEADKEKQRAEASERRSLRISAKARDEENGEADSSLESKKDIYLSQLIYDKSREIYPDCKCDDHGLFVGMSWRELTKMGAGCTASKSEVFIDTAGEKHWIMQPGWVCPRLAKIRNYYYKDA